MFCCLKRVWNSEILKSSGTTDHTFDVYFFFNEFGSNKLERQKIRNKSKIKQNYTVWKAYPSFNAHFAKNTLMNFVFGRTESIINIHYGRWHRNKIIKHPPAPCLMMWWDNNGCSAINPRNPVGNFTLRKQLQWDNVSGVRTGRTFGFNEVEGAKVRCGVY